MFLGHFGLGFVAKRTVPAVSLGTLFAAAQFADLLWPTLLLAGIERVTIAPGITRMTPLDFVSFPYSHSLAALCLWGAAFGIGYLLIRRSTVRAAVVIALLVASHWALDLIVHRPDLPLTPSGRSRFGLGLWNSPAGTIVVELAIFGAGVALYARTTRATDRVGSIGFGALVVFLLAIFFMNLFGPPPPDPTSIAWVTEAMWLLVVWAFWIDRHRVVRAWPAPSGHRSTGSLVR